MGRFAHGLLVAVALGAAALVPSAPAGASGPARLLARDELPGAWRRQAPTPTSSSTSGSGCSASRGLFAGRTERQVTFTQGPAIPSLTEVTVTGRGIAAAWASYRGHLAACTRDRVRIGTAWTTFHGSPLAVPDAPPGAVAYRYAFTSSKIAFDADAVSFYADSTIVFVVYTDLAGASPALVAAYARAAYDRLAGASPHVARDLTVTSAPLRVAETADGAVAYRSIGAGPPVLLVMGYASPMEAWDRRFVDALAAHHRVVIFDNAGIGKTSPVRGRLTIDAMAAQTSALVGALHLGPCDVVGWSMGGMVAQALAVAHPGEVRALVLLATYPGAGPVTRPRQAEVDAITDPSSPLASTLLFPKDQHAALDAFEVALSSYPAAPTVPPALEAAQRAAVLGWWSGRDPLGRRVAALRVPTLVADGEEDALDPVANDRRLARLIPGARLVLFPDAGHAFFSQEWTSASATVERFLAASAHG